MLSFLGPVLKATSFPGSSFTHPPERVGEEPEDGVAGKTY